MNTKTICRIMLSMVFVIILLSCSNEEEMSPIEREMHEMLRGTWLHDWGPDAETDHTFYTFDNGRERSARAPKNLSHSAT